MIHVYHLLGNSRATGGVLHAVRRISGYPADDISSTLVVHRDFPAAPAERVLRLPALRSDASPLRLLAGALLAFPHAYRRIRSHGVSVLHGHSRGGIMLGMLLHASTRYPLVITHHAYCRQKRVYMGMRSWRDVHYVCLTSGMCDYYGLDRRYDRVRVIPSPCPDPYFELARQRSKSTRAPAPLSFVGLGKICTGKGWGILVSALLQMPLESLQRLRFDIYGDLSDHRFCRELRRRMANHNLGDFIHLHPPTDDVQALLLRSDWMICPSRGEGLGLAAIEGMASGIPAVVSDCDGFRSFLRSQINGVEFTNGDPGSLSTVLARIADQACSVASPESISASVSDYATSTVVPKYHELYREIWR